LAGDGYDAFDPTETIHVIPPPSNDALRHCWLAGAVAEWGLRPLESAALSRRTQDSHQGEIIPIKQGQDVGDRSCHESYSNLTVGLQQPHLPVVG
jgi:hypothetical protein